MSLFEDALGAPLSLVESLEPTSACSPRVSIALRLVGAIERAHGLLKEFIEDGRPIGRIGDARRALRVLHVLLSDEDGAIHGAQIGVHSTLASLADFRSPSAVDSDDDVAAAAAEAIVATVAALPPGWGFPRKKCIDDDALPLPPFIFPCSAWAALPATDVDLIGNWIDQGTCEPAPAYIPAALIRVVPAWVHRLSSQEHVGQLLWPAAIVLGRWLAAHRAVLQGKGGERPRILELGSGPGLTGIVAGLCIAAAAAPTTGVESPPPSVVLSDFEPFVLRNLRYNAALNDAPAGAPRAFAVERLDWTELTSGAEGGLGQFDVILGSDLVCCDADATLVAETLACTLRRPCSDASPRGGVALLCFPPPRSRFGIDALEPALRAAGLWFTHRRMHASFTAEGSAAALATPGDLLRTGAGSATGVAGPPLLGAAEAADGSSSTRPRSASLAAAGVGSGHEAEIELWVVAHTAPGSTGLEGARPQCEMQQLESLN